MDHFKFKFNIENVLNNISDLVIITAFALTDIILTTYILNFSTEIIVNRVYITGLTKLWIDKTLFFSLIWVKSTILIMGGFGLRDYIENNK